MPKLIKLTDTHSVTPGNGAAFDVEGRRIALFNIEGTFYAVDDTCPHAGASLASGYLEGTKVSCPWHGADFDLCTGLVLCPPARDNLRTYRVVVEGTSVNVEI